MQLLPQVQRESRTTMGTRTPLPPIRVRIMIFSGRPALRHFYPRGHAACGESRWGFTSASSSTRGTRFKLLQSFNRVQFAQLGNLLADATVFGHPRPKPSAPASPRARGKFSWARSSFSSTCSTLRVANTLQLAFCKSLEDNDLQISYVLT